MELPLAENRPSTLGFDSAQVKQPLFSVPTKWSTGLARFLRHCCQGVPKIAKERKAGSSLTAAGSFSFDAHANRTTKVQARGAVSIIPV